jgi:predicted DNA binding CopG/RHH family protein
MKNPLKLPKFKSESEEREYWSKLDLSEHFDASDFQKVSFPNLKPTSQPVSIRMPEHLLVRLKEKANSLNVPYQALMKQYIERGLLLRDDS